ncbi:MAG: WhiB family transcriptional regulator [Actinomycetota bacterium]
MTVDPTTEGITTGTNGPGFTWMLQARCRGAQPTDFFPSDGTGVISAQHICDGCSVRSECLEYALEHQIEHGVWGGASERERRRILRRRRGAATTGAAVTQ